MDDLPTELPQTQREVGPEPCLGFRVLTTHAYFAWSFRYHIGGRVFSRTFVKEKLQSKFNFY